eukprot:1576676-Rhodomonas_salina.3
MCSHGRVNSSVSRDPPVLFSTEQDIPQSDPRRDSHQGEGSKLHTFPGDFVVFGDGVLGDGTLVDFSGGGAT